MTSEEVLALFRRTGALLEGHFILRSGLHSRQFFQCACDHLPCPRRNYRRAEVARSLGKRHILPKRRRSDSRRGFTIAPDERSIIGEDVVTCEERMQETIDIVRYHGGRAVSGGVIVDLSGGGGRSLAAIR